MSTDIRGRLAQPLKRFSEHGFAINALKLIEDNEALQKHRDNLWGGLHQIIADLFVKAAYNTRVSGLLNMIRALDPNEPVLPSA